MLKGRLGLEKARIAHADRHGLIWLDRGRLGPDRSDLDRRQATLWADPKSRLDMARQVYAIRLGEVLPHRSM